MASTPKQAKNKVFRGDKRHSYVTDEELHNRQSALDNKNTLKVEKTIMFILQGWIRGCPDLDADCELKRVKLTTSRKDSLFVGAFYREPNSPLEALDHLNNSLSD